MYTVIAENDESEWDDKTGEYYHFPERYLPLLQLGTQVVYYKGKLKNNAFKDKRKTKEPHYFGHDVIREITLDPNNKKAYFANIINYVEFELPVLAKYDNGDYIEIIPENLIKNYWRTGVRKINKEIYSTILSLAKTITSVIQDTSNEYISYQEGSKKQIYTTVYERNPKLRKEVITKKGTTCVCCGFNFSDFYGDIGKDFIHVHHVKPIHIYEGKSITVTVEDLEPVCANCHAMIHKKTSSTLSIEQLRQFIQKNRTTN